MQSPLGKPPHTGARNTKTEKSRAITSVWCVWKQVQYGQIVSGRKADCTLIHFQKITKSLCPASQQAQSAELEGTPKGFFQPPPKRKGEVRAMTKRLIDVPNYLERIHAPGFLDALLAGHKGRVIGTGPDGKEIRRIDVFVNHGDFCAALNGGVCNCDPQFSVGEDDDAGQ